MQYILYDGIMRNNLLPFTYTRAVADIRVGILTIREKWEHALGSRTYTLTQSHLRRKYPGADVQHARILIEASYLPGRELVEMIHRLPPNAKLTYRDEIVAIHLEAGAEKTDVSTFETLEFPGELSRLERTWDIFRLNARWIELDFQLITKDRNSTNLPGWVQAVNPENIFIEPGAKLLPGAILNAEEGSIYIGKNAVVMEGAMIRGPFALGENSQIKMGAKIYPGTTVGPHSKVGGEVSNSVFFGYANKAHDGYLGNSVIGEWCNLGAGTNNSNLKNNYAPVKLWSYESARFENTGLQFCGLMMGDHSKSGINTMFNTGTVVGVSANIYGSNFPRNFIPSFSWGGANGMRTYQLEKALDTARIVMSRRGLELDDTERGILEHIFRETSKYRKE